MESFESLSAKQVKYVRCLWTDISGIRRMRVVPLKRFFDSVAKSGVALCQAIQTVSACLRLSYVRPNLPFCSSAVVDANALRHGRRVDWCDCYGRVPSDSRSENASAGKFLAQ